MGRPSLTALNKPFKHATIARRKRGLGASSIARWVCTQAVAHHWCAVKDLVGVLLHRKVGRTLTPLPQRRRGVMIQVGVLLHRKVGRTLTPLPRRGRGANYLVGVLLHRKVGRTLTPLL